MKSVSTTSVVATMLVAGAAAARYSHGSLRRGNSEWPVTPEWMTLPTAKPFPPLYNLVPNRCPTGVLRVGCMYDTQTAQRRWYHEIIPKEDWLPMTPDVCYDFCRNASGAQFFGLKGGDKCFCTPFFHNTDKGGRGMCDMPCVGDHSRNCGGMQMQEVYSMHDCRNLPAYPCTRPPAQIEHAKMFNSSYYRSCPTPCVNGQKKALTTKENSHCEIQCEDGFELAHNDLMCSMRGNPLTYAWGQMQGSAACVPKECGKPPPTSHSTFPFGDLVFPEEASYTCDPGFTTNSKATGPMDFDCGCEADGNMEKPEECGRVSCGECPTDGPGAHATAVEKGFDRVYEDWCNFNCDYGYSLDQQAEGPTHFMIQCKANGEFSQVTGCKPVHCGCPPSPHHASPLNSSASASGHTYGEIVEYECDIGYTLAGVSGGSSIIQRRCQADGTYTKDGECKPVECGPPPNVAHSTFLSFPLTFNQTVTYTCAMGYTVTGKVGASMTFTLTCGAAGHYGEIIPECVPVECGTPPTVPLATVDGDPKAVVNVNSGPVHYVCNMGYSTKKDDNPRKPVMNEFSITCRPNGEFTEPPTCVNINNCRVQHCCSGLCVDVAPPTGVPLDDYNCMCDPGFEQTLINSTGRPGTKDKTCSPVNDCPVVAEGSPCGGINAHGVFRGVCTDLFQGYSCNCSTGYKLATLPELPANETCTPKPCGNAPEIDHSDIGVEVGVVDYDTPPMNYTCHKGYTLDGIASGITQFQVTCGSGGHFLTVPSCHPVSCGPPEVVTHSTINPQVSVMRFPDKITYTCYDSYSVDGTAGGATTFTVACDATGTASAVSVCKPIECPKENLRLSHSSDLSIQSTYVYTETAELSCSEGYSVDGTTHESMKTFTTTCERGGEWSEFADCIPVKCGVAKDVPYTTRSDTSSKVFTETVEYQIQVGYSLDGTPSGGMTFTVECQANGTFTPTKPVYPVSCGEAPPMDFTNGPQTSCTFEETATYTCIHGYTITGEAGGATTFVLTCSSSGTYEGKDKCQPVACGDVKPPSNAAQIPDSSGNSHTSLVYGTYATFECNVGYSPSGMMNCHALTGNVTCRPDGTLVYPPECRNNNDCSGSATNMCAPHGTCVDNAVPTGNHFDDFHCECSKGYEENATGTVRTCYNPDDCPADACAPGCCHDGLDTYSCACPKGYKVGPNEKKGFPEDCLPESCGIPEPLNHATTTVTVEVFYGGTPVGYVCESGYTLDGSASGTTTFDLTCGSSGEFLVDIAPSCQPVNCGQVPDTDNAHYPNGASYVYPHSFGYQCHTGYTSDATPTGMTDLEVSCLANGSYSGILVCTPIQCPPVPTQEMTSSSHSGCDLVFGESVTETCAAGYALNAEKHEMTEYTISCGESGALEYDETETTCVPISCGPLPKHENGDVTGSEFFGGSVTVTCHTGYSVDHTPANRVQNTTCPASGSFPKLKPCVPVSCGIAAEVKYTTRSSTSEQFFGNKVTYTIESGYTTTGESDGPKTFDVTCQSNGSFTPTVVPKPVICGDSPDRPNTTHTKCSLVYQQVVTYTCIAGHTVTGHVSGEKSFDLTCTAGGTYSGPGGCEPITCGGVRVPDHSVQVEHGPEGLLAELVYNQSAYWECAKGYSLTGGFTNTGPAIFSTKCLATGKISVHAGCTNKDDCEGNVCGAHGECVDNPVPTGEHLNDYHCKCDPGFKPNTTNDGKHSCGNIPDCPEGACVPGCCHDLISDYKCNCPRGYVEGPNAEKGWTHDCLPVTCGTPPKVPNAFTTTTGVVSYADPAVVYECENGYTLDGTAGGEWEFSTKCQADKTFETAPSCIPVHCGKPTEISDADVPDAALDFPDKVTYTCHEGFFVAGEATTVTFWEAQCLADGVIDPFHLCERVPCPVPAEEDPFGPDCAYDGGSAEGMVYGDVLQVTCLPGHALTKDDHQQTSYSVHCKSDGTLDGGGESCTPIDCGPMPEIQHGTATGSTIYGHTVHVQADEGFSLDGSATVTAQSYTMACDTSGLMVEVKVFVRVKCGYAPLVEYTSRATAPVGDSEKVFEDVVRYVLSKGYTLDGKPDGAKEFEVSCLSNGSFTPHPKPTPVQCLSPPSFDNAVACTCAVYYDHTKTYTCKPGYSTDGKASGPKSFTMRCSADGTFEGTDRCVPVECGDITPPGNAVQIPDSNGQNLGKLHFGQNASFECKAGFSKTGVLNSSDTKFDITCRPDGQFVVPAECYNNDDCVSADNACSPNGQCVDNAVPTGIHASDFHCNCDSGFVQAPKSAGSSVQVCSNVDDCPATACLNGTCQDKVNDYTCSCSPGFFLGENPGKGLPHDCLPESCGYPPVVPHASTTDNSAPTREVDFSMDPVEYACVAGYSLDSSPQCHSSFSLACEAGGTFETPPQCHPVLCGYAPQVQHAKAFAKSKEVLFPDSVQVFFPETVSYSCNAGYSLDSKTDGNTSFDVSCEASGQLVGEMQCRPVACSAPLAPDACPHATYDPQAAGALVYPQTLEVTCSPGYALHKDVHTSTTYTIECEANGRHSTPSATCTPIDCGPAPQIPHGTVKGSTLFGGTLVATAEVGYSLHGFVGVEYQSFSFHCMADGKFSAYAQFERILCGCAPEVVYSTEVFIQFTSDASASSGGAPYDPSGRGSMMLAHPTAAAPRKGRGLSVRRIPSLFARKTRRAVCDVRYRDSVKYVCLEGYHANKPGPKVTEMEAHCGADSKFETSPEGLYNLTCVPEVCQVPERTGVTPCGSGSGEVPFPQTQEFDCEEGYSLDGTPQGEWTFTESCEASGSFSYTHECKKIDYCLDSQCGNGQCVNGDYGYTCNCDAGYVNESVSHNAEKCVQIDECIKWDGRTACGGGEQEEQGTCTDGLQTYTCQCKTGYENADYYGKDSCQPVKCPDLPEEPHTSCKQIEQKMFFQMTATYHCVAGYTLDGRADGLTSFQVECGSDGTYSGFKSCIPVDCGAVTTAPNAVANTSTLTFGQVALYTCDTGYTTGKAGKTFMVGCLATGLISALEECTPVDCGVHSTIPYANGLKRLVYGQTVDVKCELGYTLSGVAGTTDEFTVGCSANASYTGIKHCVPVRCGVPPAADFTVLPATNQSYPAQFEGICEHGYTVDQDPYGATSFMVSCAADGTFTGLHTCMPVTCGAPNSTSRATAKSSSALFFGDIATYDCKPGYSVDGWIDGAMQYTRICTATGHWCDPSPEECEDINYCRGNPCSSNGVCTDLGEGIHEPGYSCSCHSGYEVEDTATGPKCTEDDCAGNPCGSGGTCTDLSKLGGENGAYSCSCTTGYQEVALANSSGKTCVRLECPPLPAYLDSFVNDADGLVVQVTTWDGRSFSRESGRDGSIAILQAADRALLTCKEGFSTDGTSALNKKSVEVRCEYSGHLSKTISSDNCQRVHCPYVDTLHDQYPTATLMNPQTSYSSSDVLHWQCAAGSTLNGVVGSANSFEVTCGNNGIFQMPSPTPVCQKIQCNVEDTDTARASCSGLVDYGTVVTYYCEGGLEVSAGKDWYSGTCQADGSIQFESSARCEPKKCGQVPTQANAHVSVAEGTVITSGESVRVTCNSGYTLGGNPHAGTHFDMTCTAEGNFCGCGTCMKGMVAVSGEVTDATSVAMKLGGVDLTFTIDGGEKIAEATTDAAGAYHVDLPEGSTIIISGTLTGYIEGSQKLTVTEPISVGGAADLSLSKQLQNGQLRIVLTWGKHSRDLDSHTRFGGFNELSGHQEIDVYYWEPSGEDSDSGLSAILDRDDKNGFGPETTTLSGIGDCTNKCLMYFAVVNYTPDDADLGDSGAVIKLYSGDELVQTWTIPKSVGDSKDETIFTIDATRGAEKIVHTGHWSGV